MPISAAAMATFMTSSTGADERIDLLVLWRGTPGWYAKGGRSGSSGGGRVGGAQQHRFYEGAHEFEVTLDRTAGKAVPWFRRLPLAATGGAMAPSAPGASVRR